jgi:pimeloyl-ACP methyl ester carboxylesterase
MTEGMTIRVNGIALRCLVEGAGDPLVLIHGVGASLEVWDGVAARLRDRYRVSARQDTSARLAGRFFCAREP